MKRSRLRPASRPASRTPLFLEQLEDRLTPSITSSGSTLTVVGDGQADTFTILDNGSGNVTATQKSAAGTVLLSAANITTIKVNGGSGQDTFSFKLTGALTSSLSLTTNLGQASDKSSLDCSAGINGGTLNVAQNGGTGNGQFSAVFGKLTNATLDYMGCLGEAQTSDKIQFNGPISGSNVSLAIGGDGGQVAISQVFAGTVSNSKVSISNPMNTGTSTDTLSFAAVNNSTLTVSVSGNGGADKVQESFGALTATSLTSTAYLGSGNATFLGTLNGPVNSATSNGVTTGSSLAFTIDGQGNDAMTFNAQGVNIATFSSVSVALNNEDGPGSDNLAVNYDGVVKGALDVAARGSAGPDTVAVNIKDEPGSTGSIFARVKGGQGNDKLTLNVFDDSGNGGKSTLTLLDAAITAMANDVLQHTPNVKIWQAS
jgi:hypothetical protein